MENISVKDRLDRPVRDLRISVTDRCNFRCTYCMPKQIFNENYSFLKPEEYLSFDEIERITRLFAQLGVKKVRLTGGEPLLRQDLPELVGRLSEVPGISDLAMITNGYLLKDQAASLKNAGLTRITVSLDSLDDEVFGKINGVGKSARNVLEGIKSAANAGLSPVKINMVVQRNVNDASVLDMVRYARSTGYIVRFIEYMDVGNCNRWKHAEVVPSEEIRSLIHREFPLVAMDQNYTGEVASRYAFADGKGEIGFISSVTQPFCRDCNRARLSADGKLYTCLFADTSTDLRNWLRSDVTDDQLLEKIRAVWHSRRDRYSEERFREDPLNPRKKIEMFQIGG